MDESQIEEIDRNARAYGWEVAHLGIMVDKIDPFSDSNPFIHKDWRERAGLITKNRESNVVKHAELELDLIHMDPWFRNGFLSMLQIFADMGHSGTSAENFIPILVKLMKQENLSPLTDDPQEWIDRRGMTGGPLWQNIRDSKCFSTDRGKSYYRVNEIDKETGHRVIYESKPYAVS